MRVDRRQMGIGSVSMVTLAGCLTEEALAEPFGVRIENRDSRSRQLWVTLTHVGERAIYEETLAVDEQRVESDLAFDSGRYQLSVVDTTDDEWTDELHVEHSSGTAFCGWFQIWADPESVTATVPRCPNDTTGRPDTDTTYPV